MTTIAYATVDDLKAAMQQGGFASDDDQDDPLLQDALDAASDWIRAQTGRVFGTTETEDRVFTATDADRLDVVDVATITAITVDTNGDLTYDRTLLTGDYELLPLDVGQPGVLGKGATIHILPTSPRQLSPGHRVKVSATWGYGSIPAGIRLAAIRLAQRTFKLFRDAPLGVLQGPPDLGTFQTIRSEDPMVAALLAPYIAAPASTSNWVVA